MEKEFKQSFISRSITGLMMILPFFGLIYIENIYLTAIAILLISLFTFLEWSKIALKKNLLLESIFIISFILGSLIYSKYFLFVWVTILVIFWLIFSIFLFFNKIESLKFIHFDNNILRLSLISGFLSSLLLLLQLDEFNHLLIFIIIFNTSLVDIFAYLAGSSFGKTPLLKNISPNKTLEGFFGGIFASLLAASGFAFLTELSFSIIVILLISALYAFVGDYFMSYLKRKSGIKDTGSILPGHGGILDRVDSHLSATVIFTFLYISFQMIAL